MKRTRNLFVRTTIASAVLMAFDAPYANADEMTQLTKPNSEIAAGIFYRSAPTTQTSQYSALRDEGFQTEVDVSITQRDESTGAWMTVTGRNLGRRDPEFRLETAAQGNWRFFIEGNVTSHYDPLTILSRNTGIGTDTVTVPATTSTAPRVPVVLSTLREKLSLGFDRQITDSVDASLRMQTEDKSGTRYFGQYGHRFAPEPISSTTDQWEARFGFTGDRLQVSAGYYGSRYQNDFARLTVTGAGADAASPIALAPNNQSHQLFVNGGFSLTPATRGNIKVSYTSATQSDAFYTAPTNAAIASVNNLDAKVNTLLVNGGITSRLTKDLNLLANVRYEDRDDRTQALQFITSTSATRNGFNFAPSRKSLGAKLEAAYRLPAQYKIVAGIDYEEIERNAPSARQASWRLENRETGGRVELRKSLSDSVNGAIKLQRSERRGSSYLEAGSATDADVIAPVHFADRTRDKVKLSADWAPVDRLSVQFAAEQSRDDYKQRDVGPNRGRAGVYSLDASYTISDDWQITGWLTHDETVAEGGSCAVANARPVGSAAGTASDPVFCGITAGNTAWRKWYSRLAMKGDSGGIGAKGKLSSKLTVGADAEVAIARSTYELRNGEGRDNAAGGTGATLVTTPTVTSDLPKHVFRNASLRLYTEYAYRPELSVRAQVQHQRVANSDWLWTDGNGNAYFYGGTSISDTANNTLVNLPRKEIVNVVGVSLSYRWW